MDTNRSDVANNIKLSSRMPLMIQVAQVLRNRITSGETPPGSRIAPELKLAEEFNVSVITIQRALKDLESESLITRHRGRGTFVAEGYLPVVQPEATQDALGLMFMDEFDKGTQLTERQVVDRPNSLAGRFPNEPRLMRIGRVVSRDGRPWSFALAHLPVDLGQRLTPALLKKYPFFRLIREHLGVALRNVEMSVEASAPTPDVAQLLNIGPLEPILIYKGSLYDESGRLVIQIQLCFPGSSFIFRLNMDLHNNALQKGKSRKAAQ